MQAERRRTPRILVADYVRVATIPPTRALALIDVSTGGFLAGATAPFDPDTMALFEFSGRDDGWSVLIAARLVHCHQRNVTGDAHEYVHGFMFVAPESPAAAAAVDRLLDYAIGEVDLEIDGV
jgi:hypothetical protein